MKIFQFALIMTVAATISNAQPLQINDEEYFDSPALSVLVFHNSYPVGMQGGIEIIQHDRRIATNGNFVYKIKDDIERIPGVNIAHVSIPKIDNPERMIDIENNRVTLPFDYEDLKLTYHLTVTGGSSGSIEIAVHFDEPPDMSLIEDLQFELMLYPEAYAGKSYWSENDVGIFPFDFTGSVLSSNNDLAVTPLMSGRHFILAAEDPLLKMEILSHAGEMLLEDNRWETQRMWFKLIAKADLSSPHEAVSITLRPHVQNDWKKPALIAVSQVGYHPGQKKRAVIELGRGSKPVEKVKLLKLQSKGKYEEIDASFPERWGDYLRYTYYVYDFSAVTSTGLYRIAFDNVTTHTFAIAENIYKSGVWQPVLDTFLPVQMCHVSVRDRGRLWHAVCHLDDALQAPAPLDFFDNFRQSGETETPFAPKTTIPGLNNGGWHDAGDDDINTGSTGRTTYHLALAIEEFGLDCDQTNVDFDKREVLLHRPDGDSDALQQVKHGVLWLLAPYRQMDHSLVGVISSDWNTYLQTADWGVFTDNLFYNPAMPSGEKDGKYSGKFDDRYAFTNKDTGREYMVAAILSASSRVLKDFDPSLAEECIRVAEQIWKREDFHKPKRFRSVGTPWNLTAEVINAAVELYLSTGDNKYLHTILTNGDDVLSHIFRTGWTVSRIIDHLDDQKFIQNFEDSLRVFSQAYAERLMANPFGVPTRKQVWGIGWNILWQAQQHYYLTVKYPDLFPAEHIYNAVNYILGVHPGSNKSLVSSVGTHRPIPAFGINRSDYSFIPGGVYSGTGLILPDYPELKEDHPYLWQQSEYMVFGATPFIFCVLAADHLLNE